jgi:hypothetical protein
MADMASPDTNIILQAGQIPFNDEQGMIQAQQFDANNMALQQQRKQQQQQNLLAKLYQNPKNVQNGVLTPQAMAQVMAIDPATGMALQQQQLKTEDSQLEVKQDQLSYLASNVSTPAMEAYQDALKVMPQPAAQQVAQQVYSDGLKQAQSSGLFSSDQSANMPQNFDPVRVGAGLETYSQFQTQNLDQQRIDLANKALAQRGELGSAALAVRAASANGGAGVSDPLAGMSFSDGSSLPSPGGGTYRPTGPAQPVTGGGTAARPPPAARPVSVGGAAASSAGAPPSAQPVPVIPGYGREGTAAVLKSYFENNKVPTFGGGAIGRRQQEAFWNAVGAAQQSQTGGTAPVDPEVQSLAQSFATYRTAPPTAQSIGRYPKIAEAWALAQQINPQASSADYPAIVQSIKNFDTGTQGNATRSLDVGIQHLDVLSKAADALGNGNVQALNSMNQTFEEQFGSPVPTNFDVTKQLVGDEIAKAIVGGPTAQADREKAQDILSRVNSPAQLTQAIGQIKDLMGGQLVGLRQQFTSSTGAPASAFDAKLLPTTLQQLNSASAQSGASPGTPAVGTVEQGYKFNGGDPANPNSWSKVQ